MRVVSREGLSHQDRKPTTAQGANTTSIDSRTRWRRLGLLALQLAVVLGTLTTTLILLSRDASGFDRAWILWTITVAVIEALPVPAWHGLTVSLGFPLLMVVAFVYVPQVAALAAFLGATDPREVKGEVGLLRALFNRSQVALSVLVASAAFHALANLQESPPLELLLAALLADVLDYSLNSGLIAGAVSLDSGMSLLRVIRELRVGRLSEFLISYIGLAFFGLFLAKFYESVGFWAVPVFILPLLLARQMFFRSKALEEAHKELQDREQVLRTLSNRMAEERQDERQQIAAFLHDDLAQHLFRLSIQVDVARRHLSAGDLKSTETTLQEIKEIKSRTADRIRALIRDLDRSPIGRAGLGEALRSFIAEMGRDSDVEFHTEIEEIDLPPPIALLLYHIAREGVLNALKHAHATNVWVSVRKEGDEVAMLLRDDGRGFDPDEPEPEGHYGLTMMRERATVGRGTLEVQSSPETGTSVTVRFPTSWLLEETSGEQPRAAEAGSSDAAHGNGQAARGTAPQSVRA